MLLSSIPTKVQLPWGAGAGPAFIRPIPVPSQIGIQGGAASFTDGFPPLTFQPVGAGGIPPFGEDMNGILNQITAWNRWQAAGGPINYDSGFQAVIGGYPNGAIVGSLVVPGTLWRSTVDNNVTNPDAGGSGWTQFSVLGASVGDFKWRPTAETLPGWVMSDTSTIGSGASSASQLASASAANAFAWLWTNFSNTQCPVSSGRGVSAAADFAANKTIATIDMRGITPAGVDKFGSTYWSGVPVVSGGATIPGSILGEMLHALSVGELATHNHATIDVGHVHLQQSNTALAAGGGSLSSGGGGQATGGTTQNATTGILIQNTGNGNGHNTAQRTMAGTWYCKL